MALPRLSLSAVAFLVASAFMPASGESSRPATAVLRVEPGHPWTPPFGLDRVGRPLEAVVELPRKVAPAEDYALVGTRDGKEVSRQALTFDTSGRLARAPLPAWPAEVALWVKPNSQAQASEAARAEVKPPALEAEAVARPDAAIHPVDLGTILVPHDWLLLAGGQKATVEATALKRDAGVPGARAVAWYESAPGEKAAVAMPLKRGETARATLAAGAGSRAEKKDALHVTIEDGEGKALWTKTIRVMRVPEPPRRPAFGAVATQLRYDAPIPVNGAPRTIDYDKGWDPKLDDVVVFFPNGARFVFWRGASYCPFWAGRSNTGFCYEWAEILSGHGIPKVRDCVEPLQDKELRYGRVEIVESTPARAHVRWSYQSCDLEYKVAGSFAAEEYFFYPDGFGTRVMTLTANPGCRVETNEFIVFLPQSGYPFDLLPNPLIDFVWPGGKAEVRFPCARGEPPELWGALRTIGKEVPLMHRIRLGKGDRLAAICYSPWGSTHDLPGFAPFSDRGAQVTPMYWGCHWPLSRGYPTEWKISDRIHESPGHSSSIHAGTPRALRSRTGEMRDAQGNTKRMQRDTWVWLIGMTDADDDALRRWASSFALQPPALELSGAKPDDEPYAPERRALRLVVEKPSVAIALKPSGHCVNPVFELRGAPKTLARAALDGTPLDPARYAWDGTTLWLDATLSRPAQLRLEFMDAPR
jgi:hypothetical protein